MFRLGYIINPRADLLWFLGFPFLGVAVALACHQWLPAVAWASIGLWVTIPHHWATWLRTYGLSEDWQRWKPQLIAGPLVIFGMALLGLKFAPTTLLMVGVLWDHQHSLMQQHGLARIYDFKARAGTPITGRLDLLLHWFLYVNMLITAPLFADTWVREVYSWGVSMTPASMKMLQNASWGATGIYVLVYLAYSASCLARGIPLNPLKYVFIATSYFLWYFTSWHTDSFLVFGIAHRLMHGVQYIVIVYAYLGRKVLLGDNAEAGTASASSWVAKLVRSRAAWAFIGAGVLYALVYQLVVLAPLDQFGFGAFNFMAVYGDVPTMGMGGINEKQGYDLFAAAMINALPITHYYFDSFIWKVRDVQVQQGL
ncbi:MAG TPA: hypothetical protein VFB96_24995 [Pirellulaceae bacterium]|nr:hypothetical protein [Pirellulaceae bacterium]